VDPLCRFVAIHAYSNSLKIIPITKKNSRPQLNHAYNLRVDQNNIMSMVLLKGQETTHVKIAILN
jgi:hypothetical protein